MFSVDPETHRQFVRERAAELAREYDRARRSAPRASRRRVRPPAAALMRVFRPSRRTA